VSSDAAYVKSMQALVARARPSGIILNDGTRGASGRLCAYLRRYTPGRHGAPRVTM